MQSKHSTCHSVLSQISQIFRCICVPFWCTFHEQNPRHNFTWNGAIKANANNASHGMLLLAGKLNHNIKFDDTSCHGRLDDSFSGAEFSFAEGFSLYDGRRNLLGGIREAKKCYCCFTVRKGGVQYLWEELHVRVTSHHGSSFVDLPLFRRKGLHALLFSRFRCVKISSQLIVSTVRRECTVITVLLNSTLASRSRHFVRLALCCATAAWSSGELNGMAPWVLSQGSHPNANAQLWQWRRERQQQRWRWWWWHFWCTCYTEPDNFVSIRK